VPDPRTQQGEEPLPVVPLPVHANSPSRPLFGKLNARGHTVSSPGLPCKVDQGSPEKGSRHTQLKGCTIMNAGANTREQIKKYIAGQPAPKRKDMQELHRIIQRVMPASRLWFLDGKNGEHKTVSNPNIGYGIQTIEYANGKIREFYRVGISANKTGLSVYILGIKNRKYLAQTYGKRLGKASVSGYCIKFRTLTDINVDILEAAIRDGLEKSD
jgi:hypothetical protein